MHDIRAIRDDPAAFDAAMARRRMPPLADAVIAVDAERRAALTTLQERQSHRNVLAKQVAQGRRAGSDTAALEAESGALKDEMAALEALASEREQTVTAMLDAVPNLLDASVPDGVEPGQPEPVDVSETGSGDSDTTASGLDNGPTAA